LGDGSEAFDFVAVEDCARANLLAMRATASDRFYNVGTGTRTSLKELAERICKLTACEQPVQYQPRSQATLVRNRIGATSRAAKDLNFTAEIPLDEGLRRLIEWRGCAKATSAKRRASVGDVALRRQNRVLASG
jgi:UDP-glucose 4-epimerase